jgi:hypothetical protein
MWSPSDESLYQHTIKVLIDSLDFNNLRSIARFLGLKAISKDKLISELYKHINLDTKHVTNEILQQWATFLDMSDLPKNNMIYKTVMLAAPPTGNNLPTPMAATRREPHISNNNTTNRTQIGNGSQLDGVLIISHKLGKSQPLPVIIGTSLSTVIIRCVCGMVGTFHKVLHPANSIVSCQSCHVCQHTECVYKTTSPTASHTCEQCRLQKHITQRDPFQTVIGAQCPIPITPSNGIQTFVANTRYSASVICIPMQQDKPPHWPQNTKIIITSSSESINISTPGNGDFITGVSPKSKINLTLPDEAEPCILSIFWTTRSQQGVRAIMGKPLSSDEAIKRVKEYFSLGADGIETLSEKVSLRCPLSMSRMKTPVRFDDSPVLGSAFDLDTFLACGKWQCPHTGRRDMISTLRVDTFLHHILENIAPHIMEIEVSSDGNWRAIEVEQTDQSDSIDSKLIHTENNSNKRCKREIMDLTVE